MKQFLKFLLILLPSLGEAGGGFLYGQLHGQGRIDSLLKELSSQKDDSNKVRLLGSLSFSFYSINPDMGVKYGLQELELAEKLKMEQKVGYAYDDIGVNYQYKSDYTSALAYYDSAVSVYVRLKDDDDLAGSYGNIGYTYTLSGDFEKALVYDLKALNTFEQINNKPKAAITLGNIGSLYMNKGDYAKALDYSFKALKINEESDNKSIIATNLGSIGSIYTMLQNYRKALDYYFKALKINTELGKKSGTAGNYANIGAVYEYQKENAKALEYNFRALNIYEEMGAKTGIALALGNIGVIYADEHNYRQSVAFLFKALRIARDAGDKNTEAAQLGAISESYLRMATDTFKNDDIIVATELYKKPEMPDSLIPTGTKAMLHKALVYATAAINMENQVGNLNYQQQFYHDLSKIDSVLGNYHGSLDAYEQYKKLEDSAFNGENKIKITNLETKRDMDLKDKQIELDKLAVEKKRNERILFVAGIVLLLMVIVFILRNYYGQKKSNVLLLKEKKQSENLLLNILPGEIAAELKTTGTTTARHYNNVTVLFTDFVNFTEAGERMSPQALIDELHTCFKAFDEITGKYKVEKIKTIGDAYLAVAGLPTTDPLHAEHVVRAAIEINAYMQDRFAKLGNNTFEIRIGIHSGSVVAGIVGVKKFAYDIWGDTVNTAARMEQNSEAGRINISAITYELVKDKIPCTYRGEIDAKGKGQLKMYFVG